MCRDLSTDPGNCGACGHACDVGNACIRGACETLSTDRSYELMVGAGGTGLHAADGALFGLDRVRGFNLTLGGGMRFSSRIGIALDLDVSFSTIRDASSSQDIGFRDISFAVGPEFFLYDDNKFLVRAAALIGVRALRTEVATELGGSLRLRAQGQYNVYGSLYAGVYFEGGAVLGTDIPSTPWDFGGGIVASYVIGAGAPEVPSASVLPSQLGPVFVRVESSSSVRRGEAESAQVIETPRYQELRPRIRTVAVVAPDRCANRTLSQATGQGAASGEVMGTTCGVEMGEIENLLSGAGYRVISWRTMQDLEGLPRERASELGAEMLFQVNSLEQSEDMRGLVRAERVNRFYNSNEFGDRLNPAALRESDATRLELAVGGGSSAAQAIPGAGLDLQAVDVASGQLLWSYRWRRLLRSGANASVSQLFRGEVAPMANAAGLAPVGQPTQQMSWQLVLPQSRDVTPSVPQEGYRTGGRSTQSTTVGSQNTLQAELFGLLTEIIQDAVSKFRCGVDQPCGAP